MPSSFNRGSTQVESQPIILSESVKPFRIIGICPYCRSNNIVTDEIHEYSYQDSCFHNEPVKYQLYERATCINCSMEFFGGYDITDKHFIMFDDKKTFTRQEKDIMIKQAINSDIKNGFKKKWRERQLNQAGIHTGQTVNITKDEEVIINKIEQIVEEDKDNLEQKSVSKFRRC